MVLPNVSDSSSDLAEVLEELSNLEQNVVDTLLKPKHYGLIARA